MLERAITKFRFHAGRFALQLEGAANYEPPSQGEGERDRGLCTNKQPVVSGRDLNVGNPGKNDEFTVANDGC